MLALVVATAVSFPGGYTGSCSRTSHTVPAMPIASTSTTGATISCDGLNCTLSGLFRGYVVSADVPISGDGYSFDGGHCLTHTEPSDKNSISFSVSGPTTVWATVVTENIGGQHNVILAPAFPVSRPGRVYVVGAGPGGISAARYLEANNVAVTVLERGPDVFPNFYSGPIRDTYYASLNASYKFNPLSNNIVLASMVGGNQNANGAVFKPGSASDLASVTGVSSLDAQYAQEVAASYVVVNNEMMWQCINESDCDSGTVAVANLKMARRSVAFNESLADLQTGVEVESVSSTEIRLANGTTISVGDHDSVILAAGALVGFSRFFPMRPITYALPGIPAAPRERYIYRPQPLLHAESRARDGLNPDLQLQRWRRNEHRDGNDAAWPLQAHDPDADGP